MLRIIVPAVEGFDEKNGSFVTLSGFALDLEHSLVSLSKWESRFERPFLDKRDKTSEEIFEYIKCMVLTPDVPPEVFERLTQQNLDEIKAYVEAKMTASWVNEDKGQKSSRETITSELIYYWMSSMGIPWEAQHWHLNRLLMLIKIATVKNAPQKKMSKKELMERNRRLNAERKAQWGTKG